jgi:cytidine deaminase
MNKKEYQFSFDEYNSLEDLPTEDASLLKDARKLTESAYAPYSNFKAGAVAKLGNGKIVSNQSGKCLLSCWLLRRA